ncbi:MAG: homocysteine S-methyltransferase family protein [Deltaproteobacteria bacterium]|nr:MAG: homocysteine S-methyltransferase family protein [Deltaproteobacteria bacterium]
MLMAMGLKKGDCPERWTLTNAEKVKELHSAYVQAGARMILTNSFGANRFKLKKYDLQDQLYQLNCQAASNAKEAAGGKAFVAASVGPTGELLKPLGPVEEAEAIDAFKEQIVAVADGGADLILLETMTDLKEATLAIRAAKENTDLPVFCTFTYNLTKVGFRTIMGVDPDKAVKASLEAGADVIGANCGEGMEQMIPLVKEIRRSFDGYILVHANAGMPRLVEGETVYDETPEKMAELVAEILDAGVNIVGGCCGTTPEHTAAMAKAIGEWKDKNK